MADKSIKKTFSDNLLRLLKSNNITYEKLAEMLDKNVSSVSRWISGGTWVKPQEVEKLADIFGVSEQYFFTDHSDNTPDYIVTDTNATMRLLMKQLQELQSAQSNSTADLELQKRIDRLARLSAAQKAVVFERLDDLIEVAEEDMKEELGSDISNIEKLNKEA